MSMLSEREMKKAIENRGKLSNEKLQTAIEALSEIIMTNNGTSVEIEMYNAFVTEIKLRKA